MLKVFLSHRLPPIVKIESDAFTVNLTILRKTIEGYLDSVPSLTFNTIKTKPIMHAFHSYRYLQSNLVFNLSYASIIKVQYRSKWCNPLYWKVTNIQNDSNPFFSFVFHNYWLQNHCWLSVKRMTPYFVVVVSILLKISGHIGWGMPYQCIFVEEVVTLLGAITYKWVWTLLCGQN